MTTWARTVVSATGEVVEGADVEFIKVRDIVSVPSNIFMRPLPELQGAQDRYLPERQS